MRCKWVKSFKNSNFMPKICSTSCKTEPDQFTFCNWVYLGKTNHWWRFEVEHRSHLCKCYSSYKNWNLVIHLMKFAFKNHKFRQSSKVLFKESLQKKFTEKIKHRWNSASKTPFRIRRFSRNFFMKLSNLTRVTSHQSLKICLCLNFRGKISRLQTDSFILAPEKKFE